MPSISVIVPCYNQAQFLDECLDSVLGQSFQDWECIIVNDGSSDNTIEVANNWVEKDKRFKLITTENAGVSNARNIGVENSNSELILPLDGDDKIAPLYLEKGYKAYASGRCDVVYARAEYFGIRVGETKVSFKSLKSLLLSNQIYVTALFSKKDFYEIGGYDVNMDKGYEDWEFWIRLLSAKNEVVKKLDYVGFYYTIKDISRNQSINNNEKEKQETLDYMYVKNFNVYVKHYGSPYNL